MHKALYHPEQHLLRFRAHDGFLVSAHLLTKDFQPAQAETHPPVILHVHGLLGHFLARGTPRVLPYELLERGIWSLSINTRLAFAGQITGQGIFDDTIHEIDAAVSYLTHQGFRRIVLLGYSLGASMVVHWAAHRDHPAVHGLILEGPHYSIPDSQRRRLERWGSIPGYEEIAERARSLLGEEPARSQRDETFVIYRSRGPTTEPNHDELFTYKTWWYMMGPEAHAAMAHKHIDRITRPLLLLRGEHDPLIEPWEPEALARQARSAGNQQVVVREIPQAGHDCVENAPAMLEALTSFLAQTTRDCQTS